MPKRPRGPPRDTQEDPGAAKKPKDRRSTIDLKTVSGNGFWREGGCSFPVRLLEGTPQGELPSGAL
eukprot:748636-Pyramimonas_sp.AAC.1